LLFISLSDGGKQINSRIFTNHISRWQTNDDEHSYSSIDTWNTFEQLRLIEDKSYPINRESIILFRMQKNLSVNQRRENLSLKIQSQRYRINPSASSISVHATRWWYSRFLLEPGFAFSESLPFRNLVMSYNTELSSIRASGIALVWESQ
jgi:hypothetical protein